MIEAITLTKGYGPTAAVEELTLTIRPGASRRLPPAALRSAASDAAGCQAGSPAVRQMAGASGNVGLPA